MSHKVAFECNGFPVVLPVGADEMPEETADKWIRSFKEWEEECVQGAGKEMLSFEGSFKVDWGVYFRLNHLCEISNQFLVDVGMFSFSAVGHWEIVGSGHLNLNPWNRSGRVIYFTREEDVVAYARLKYGRAVYSWHMQKIALVIPGN